MVIPGDPEEMAEFQAQTMAASQYALEATFPTAHIFLPSKEFYESIYNRSASLLCKSGQDRASRSHQTPLGKLCVPLEAFLPIKWYILVPGCPHAVSHLGHGWKRVIVCGLVSVCSPVQFWLSLGCDGNEREYLKANFYMHFGVM